MKGWGGSWEWGEEGWGLLERGCGAPGDGVPCPVREWGAVPPEKGVLCCWTRGCCAPRERGAVRLDGGMLCPWRKGSCALEKGVLRP